MAYYYEDLNIAMLKSCKKETGNHYIAHTEPLFKLYYKLNVKDLYHLKILKFYYNLCCNRLPQYFNVYQTGLGSSTVDQVLKYTKYPKYIPSTSTGQVLIF